MKLTRAVLVLVVLIAASAGPAHAQRSQGKKAPPPAPVQTPEVSKSKAPPTGRERIVGILDVRGPTPSDEATFEKSLEEQLDTKTYWLATRATLRERLRNSTKWTEGCIVHSCLGEVKVQTGADVVVLAALTGAGTSFGFVVTVLRTDSGTVVAQEAERCDVCTFNETMNAAVLATIRLLSEVPPKLPDEAAQARASVELAVHNAVQPLEKQLARSNSTQKLGIALTVIGIAALGGGAAWYFAGDKPKGGLATMAGGGGLAVGGISVLVF